MELPLRLMTVRRWGLIFVGFGICAGPAELQAGQGDWRVWTTVQTSKGDYGTPSTVESNSIELTIERLFEDGQLSLSVPLAGVTTSGEAIPIRGVPQRTGKFGAFKKNGQGPVTHIGAGDLVLRTYYQFLNDEEDRLTMGVNAHIKIPTANEKMGLGTGRFDEGFGLEFANDLAGNFVGYLDVGYTSVGSPPGAALRDQWNYGGGIGYYFGGAWLGSLRYEESLALLAGQANPQSLILFVDSLSTFPHRLRLSLSFGLSDGSPGFGARAGVGLLF